MLTLPHRRAAGLRDSGSRAECQVHKDLSPYQGERCCFHPHLQLSFYHHGFGTGSLPEPVLLVYLPYYGTVEGSPRHVKLIY